MSENKRTRANGTTAEVVLSTRPQQAMKEENITCIVATHDKEDVLGYADKMLVLDHGKCIAHDTPQTLYSQPGSQLIASFFDEYNEFSVSEISTNTNGEQILFVYAHQVNIVRSSDLKAEVVQSLFKGDHYLIEALFNRRSIFLYHNKDLKKGQQICFEVKQPIAKI